MCFAAGLAHIGCLRPYSQVIPLLLRCPELQVWKGGLWSADVPGWAASSPAVHPAETAEHLKELACTGWQLQYIQPATAVADILTRHKHRTLLVFI